MANNIELILISGRSLFVCQLPALFFSIIGLLAAIPAQYFFNVDLSSSSDTYSHLGTVVIILSLFYYLRLSIVLFIGMLFFSLVVLYGINYVGSSEIIPLWMSMLLVFVTACVSHFVGLRHEGNAIFFYRGAQYLMIDPAWVMSYLFSVLKIKL